MLEAVRSEMAAANRRFEERAAARPGGGGMTADELRAMPGTSPLGPGFPTRRAGGQSLKTYSPAPAATSAVFSAERIRVLEAGIALDASRHRDLEKMGNEALRANEEEVQHGCHQTASAASPQPASRRAFLGEDAYTSEHESGKRI